MVLCVCPVPVQLRIRSAGGLFQQAGQVEKRAAAEIQNFGSPRLQLPDNQGSLAAALFPLTRDVGKPEQSAARPTKKCVKFIVLRISAAMGIRHNRFAVYVSPAMAIRHHPCVALPILRLSHIG